MGRQGSRYLDLRTTPPPRDSRLTCKMPPLLCFSSQRVSGKTSGPLSGEGEVEDDAGTTSGALRRVFGLARRVSNYLRLNLIIVRLRPWPARFQNWSYLATQLAASPTFLQFLQFPHRSIRAG
jgi:hypothetical protein